MGEDLTASPQEVKTIEEVFTDACPYFMAIGMTYDEFWYQDPHIAKMFLKAHEIRQKQDNERLWLQGYYFYIALCDVAPVLNAFAKKGTKVQNYPSEPLALSQEEIEQREEVKRQNRLLALKHKLLNSVKKEG